MEQVTSRLADTASTKLGLCRKQSLLEKVSLELFDLLIKEISEGTVIWSKHPSII
mgnify:FL=1